MVAPFAFGNPFFWPLFGNLFESNNTWHLAISNAMERRGSLALVVETTGLIQ